MMPTLSRMSLNLSREQGVRLVNALGTRIECRSGALWISVDNDPRDVVLDAGQAFTLDSDQGTIVQAILGPAEVALAQDCDHAATARPAPNKPMSLLHSLRAALAWAAVGSR